MLPTLLVTHYLTRDHGRLHGLLAQAMQHGSVDADAFAAFRKQLLRHIAIEEKVLLPAVKRARGGVPLARARELRIDHAALTSLLVPSPDEALCRELLALLSEHDAKEEGPLGVYSECEDSLSRAESSALAASAAAYPEVRVAPHFDGPGVYRTAALALASARRIKESRP